MFETCEVPAVGILGALSVKNPKVLFVSRERLRLPLEPTQQRKWDSIARHLDILVLAASASRRGQRDERFALWPALPVLDGPGYYAALPARIAASIRSFRPDLVFVQGVHEAAEVIAVRAALRSPARIVLDVQGDWRAATRLYGSPARRLLDPLNDSVGKAVVRNVDGVRTLSEFTSSLVRALGVDPLDTFPPFVDAEVFLAPALQPLPASPTVLFVGVLERYKGFDTLAEAWARVSGAELHIVGRGTLAERARRLVEQGARWTPALDADGVRRAMDESTLLCLPSRAEGLGRVVIEAMCRGRAVVGGAAGGIIDLVEDGVDGALVDPDDPAALAEALERVLHESGRMGAAARANGERLAVPAAEYGARIAGVVRTVLADPAVH